MLASPQITRRRASAKVLVMQRQISRSPSLPRNGRWVGSSKRGDTTCRRYLNLQPESPPVQLRAAQPPLESLLPLRPILRPAGASGPRRTQYIGQKFVTPSNERSKRGGTDAGRRREYSLRAASVLSRHHEEVKKAERRGWRGVLDAGKYCRLR